VDDYNREAACVVEPWYVAHTAAITGADASEVDAALRALLPAERRQLQRLQSLLNLNRGARNWSALLLSARIAVHPYVQSNFILPPSTPPSLRHVTIYKPAAAALLAKVRYPPSAKPTHSMGHWLYYWLRRMVATLGDPNDANGDGDGDGDGGGSSSGGGVRVKKEGDSGGVGKNAAPRRRQCPDAVIFHACVAVARNDVSTALFLLPQVLNAVLSFASDAAIASVTAELLVVLQDAAATATAAPLSSSSLLSSLSSSSSSSSSSSTSTSSPSSERRACAQTVFELLDVVAVWLRDDDEKWHAHIMATRPPPAARRRRGNTGGQLSTEKKVALAVTRRRKRALLDAVAADAWLLPRAAFACEAHTRAVRYAEAALRANRQRWCERQRRRRPLIDDAAADAAHASFGGDGDASKPVTAVVQAAEAAREAAAVAVATAANSNAPQPHRSPAEWLHVPSYGSDYAGMQRERSRVALLHRVHEYMLDMILWCSYVSCNSSPRSFRLVLHCLSPTRRTATPCS
jgi:hypothetical protein